MVGMCVWMSENWTYVLGMIQPVRVIGYFLFGYGRISQLWYFRDLFVWGE